MAAAGPGVAAKVGMRVEVIGKNLIGKWEVWNTEPDYHLNSVMNSPFLIIKWMNKFELFQICEKSSHCFII